MSRLPSSLPSTWVVQARAHWVCYSSKYAFHLRCVQHERLTVVMQLHERDQELAALQAQMRHMEAESAKQLRAVLEQLRNKEQEAATAREQASTARQHYEGAESARRVMDELSSKLKVQRNVLILFS